MEGAEEEIEGRGEGEGDLGPPFWGKKGEGEEEWSKEIRHGDPAEVEGVVHWPSQPCFGVFSPSLGAAFSPQVPGGGCKLGEMSRMG